MSLRISAAEVYANREVLCVISSASSRASAANVVAMPQSLCLLSVHAHPDDEASKGAGTVARYHAEGVRTVLVTCTGGEEGEILNPSMDSPENRRNLPAVRREELERSAAIIGFDEVVMLGYRDSGMADTKANLHPDCFAQAPIDEAVERLVRIIRRERPQVVITYPEDQNGYRHPDHLRVHEVSVLAFDAAGDPTRFPEAGPPYSPRKLYYSVWPLEQFRKRHEKFAELGMESPFTEERFASWFARESPEATTRIELGAYSRVQRAALLAHATQIDPSSPFWFGLPPEVEETISNYELFFLASGVSDVVTDRENDLFLGVRSDPKISSVTS